MSKLVQKYLPDGRTVNVPAPIDIYKPEILEHMFEPTWELILQYLVSMGIKFDENHVSNIIKPIEQPDEALIGAVQNAIVHTLETECQIDFRRIPPESDKSSDNYFGRKPKE